MPNFANVLKEEISRLARKEAKRTEKSLRDTVAFLRHSVLSQKKKIASLEKDIAVIMKKSGLSQAVEVSNPDEVEKSRFSPKLIARLRKKLDLSRSDMAALVGVNPNSIFLWEKGQTSPRFAAKARLLELRTLGKRGLKKRLDTLKVSADAASDAESDASSETAAKKAAKPKKQKKAKKAVKTAKVKTAKSKAFAKKAKAEKKAADKKVVAEKVVETAAPAEKEVTAEAAT